MNFTLVKNPSCTHRFALGVIFLFCHKLNSFVNSSIFLYNLKKMFRNRTKLYGENFSKSAQILHFNLVQIENFFVKGKSPQIYAEIGFHLLLNFEFGK